MGKIKWMEAVAKSNAVASWAERLLRWGDVVGIKGWLQFVVAFVVSSGWSGFTHFVGFWSWWIAIPVGLFAATYALKAYGAFRTALSIRGTKPIVIASVGKDCVEFYSDLMSFLVERVDTAPNRPSEISNSARVEWAQSAEYSGKTRARVVQRFASRAHALAHVLETIGVRPPNLWAFDSNAAGIATYIGAIGELLEAGHLKEARTLDPDQRGRMMVHVG